MAEIRKWSGLRTTDSAERLKLGEMTVASDVDINNSMKVLSRPGQTVVNSTAAHSLFSNGEINLIMHGNVMKSLDPTALTFTTLATLTSSNPVSYDTWANVVYYCNGVDKGRIVGSTPKRWGIALPPSQPSAAATIGNMPAGRYLYAITYLRNDGQESGTGLSGLVELSTTGGIFFSNITASTESDISGIMLYISSTNGEQLYLAATIPNGQTTYNYTGDVLGVALNTQFLSPPPIGTMVRYFNGQLYVVVGGTVYISEPYRPELFKLDTSFLQFDANVTMFEWVNSGYYLGTETETWYISGESAESLFDYGVIAGTAVRTLASKFETSFEGESQGEQAKYSVVWTSKGHGICVGKEGGAAVNLTEVRNSGMDAQAGAAIVREHRGFNSYVVSLRGASESSNIFEE